VKGGVGKKKKFAQGKKIIRAMGKEVGKKIPAVRSIKQEHFILIDHCFRNESNLSNYE
jgi:hypothetical protein